MRAGRTGGRAPTGEGSRPTVLITGIAGGKGQVLARRLADRWRVVGVDRLPWRSAPRGVEVHVADLRKRPFQDLVRRRRPAAVVHLALVRHFQVGERERYDINVHGTRRLFEHCVRYGVRRVVVVSSATVYGALEDNPHYLTEEAALNASLLSPEIRDLVQADTLATTFLWRYPDLSTVVLRPVYLVGPSVHSVVCRYLRLRRVPMVLGFDPLFQVMHEEDGIEAIAQAVEVEGLRGVYNVAGPGAVPLSVVIREAGRRPLAVPELLLRPLVGRLFRARAFPFPEGSLPFIQYPCTVDGEAFRRATGFAARWSLRETLRSLGGGRAH
ncbi:MAG: NAD-dependent epimerase/dehydratase family protein [Planctomycetes bacterium]|nr:NAD-dependent epimerase/dehydratase family protein [Planctomycetota bacterium]